LVVRKLERGPCNEQPSKVLGKQVAESMFCKGQREGTTVADNNISSEILRIITIN